MTLCIFGAGGHAVSVWDAAHTHYDKIVFFAKDGPKTLCGCAVYHNTEGLRYDEAIVAVGDNLTRLRMTRDIANKGATLATVVHPTAYVSPLAVVGPGSCVLAQAAVNAGARTGVACIINTGAVVEHECELGCAVHLSPRAALAGRCKIGDCAWLGIGASVIQGISIGQRSIIAAGAAVICDIPHGCMAAGVPATVRKKI